MGTDNLCASCVGTCKSCWLLATYTVAAERETAFLCFTEHCLHRVTIGSQTKCKLEEWCWVEVVWTPRTALFQAVVISRWWVPVKLTKCSFSPSRWMYNLIFLVEVEYSNMTNASVVFFPQVLELLYCTFWGTIGHSGLLDFFKKKTE